MRDTFSSRVGQICNAALDRSIIAYNENSNDEERQRCWEETELLAILTGLEIDSAKSGVRPDLEEFLGQRTVKRAPFLQYKYLAEHASPRRAWYEPTHTAKLKAFFDKVDWSQVDSNVERLPYLAHQLKKHTPKLKPVSAQDKELFAFSVQPDWQSKFRQGYFGHGVHPAQGLRGVSVPHPSSPGTRSEQKAANRRGAHFLFPWAGG